MKNFQVVFFSLICLTSYAQSSFETGSTWTYSQNSIGGPTTPTHIEVIGDTLINGVTWHLLEGQGRCAFNPNDSPLLRKENSKWYTYNISEQRESLLYDFALNSGDSYAVDFFGDNFIIEMFVDSTATIEINNTSHKIQYCSNPNSNLDGFVFGSLIIEGIGSTGYLFPQGNNCDPHAGPIRCYENSSQFIDFDDKRDCDESFFPTNTADLYDTKSKVYPNPAMEHQLIKIESHTNIVKVSLFDTTGKLVLDQDVNDYETRVNVQRAGIYHLVIESNSNRDLKRIVITN